MTRRIQDPLVYSGLIIFIALCGWISWRASAHRAAGILAKRIDALEARVAELERQSENNGNLAARGLALGWQICYAFGTNRTAEFLPAKSNGLWTITRTAP